MNKFAVIFPGQGSQYQGMLNDYQNNPMVMQACEEASDAVGYNMWDLIADNPDNKLNATEYTQPAILTASIAMLRLLQQYVTDEPIIVAGHSLGEYSALVAAQSIKFAEAVPLVQVRGRLMQSAYSSEHSAMAAVIGLDDILVQELCTKVSKHLNKIVAPANYNSPGQVVIAGERAAVVAALEEATQIGARMTRILDVSVAAHSQLMQPIEDKFAQALDKVLIVQPMMDVVSNVSGNVYKDLLDIKSSLVKQLSYPVRWVDCINTILQHTNIMIECGPGQVLSKLCRRINKSINSFSIDGAAKLQQIHQSIGESSA